MPDPESGLYRIDPEDPDVCLSLDGRIRYNDVCECGTVTDLRRYRGDWLCRSCIEEARAEEDDDDEMFE